MGSGPRLRGVFSELRVGFEHDFDEEGVGQILVDGQNYYRNWVNLDYSMAWGLGGTEYDEVIASLNVTPPGFGPISRSVFQLGYRYLQVPGDIAARSLTSRQTIFRLSPLARSAACIALIMSRARVTPSRQHTVCTEPSRCTLTRCVQLVFF